MAAGGPGRTWHCQGLESSEEREASSTPGRFGEVQMREGLLTPAELLRRGRMQRQSMLSLSYARCEGRGEYGLLQRRTQRHDEGRDLQRGI